MTKELNSVEYLIEQVVMGTYKNGEDKILYKTLPNAMIEGARKLHRLEIQKAFTIGLQNWDSELTPEQYYDETYGGCEQ